MRRPRQESEALSGSCRARGLQGGDQGRVLTLLGEFQTGVVIPLLQLLLPVEVQRVDDPLGVVLSGSDHVALVLLRLEGHGREAALRNPRDLAHVTQDAGEYL